MPDSDNTDLRGNPDTDHYDRVLALAHAQGFTMGTSGPDKTGRYVHSLSMIHGPFVLYGVNLEEVEAYIAESKVEGGRAWLLS